MTKKLKMNGSLCFGCMLVYAGLGLAVPAAAQDALLPEAATYRGSFEINAMMPLLQNGDRMIYLGADGTLHAGDGPEDNDTAYNLGTYLGYRAQTNLGIVGIWGGFDVNQGQFGNAFARGIGGVEYLGNRFIARFGGFIPFDDSSESWTYSDFIVPANQFPIFSTAQLEEQAPSGIDGELGVRIPIMHAGIAPEMRVFAGGYSFFDVEEGGGDVSGWRTRMELDVYPFQTSGDMRVTLTAQYSEDDAQGSHARGGIRLAFPFGEQTTTTCCASGSIKDEPAEQPVAQSGNMFEPVWRNRDPATGLRVIDRVITPSFAAAASDRRLKRDIELLATSESGIRIYSFRYLPEIDASGRVYVGVMAQDLIATHPEALVVMDNGYYAVHYDRLGLRMTTREAWDAAGQAAVLISGPGQAWQTGAIAN
jgi:hypothetical protein